MLSLPSKAINFKAVGYLKIIKMDFLSSNKALREPVSFKVKALLAELEHLFLRFSTQYKGTK